MSRPALRASIGVAAAIVVALALSACVAVKPGSRAMIQPAGIGAVHATAVLCTEGGGKLCVPRTEAAVQGQMMMVLMVPAGTTTPQSFTVPSTTGSPALTYTRSPEVASAFASWAKALAEIPETTVIPPPTPGFEPIGYLSGVFGEPVGLLQEWALDVELGLPPTADGGSYGGPLKVTMMSGWREVTPALPASRPVSCSGTEFEEETALCEPPGGETELTLGVSEMKINPPPTAVATPGQTAKLPFALDFASSAAPPPTFKLAVTTTLGGASARPSNTDFTRVPADPATNRAPLTTRKAVVEVPKAAQPGLYEVTMTATTPQGGTVSSTGSLRIKPKGKLRIKLPRKVAARQAYRKGVPVRVTTRLARTKVVVRILGPKPNGRGKRQLAKRRALSKGPETLLLRSKLRWRLAETLRADKAKLQAEVKVFEPGKKPRKPRRTFRLK